MEAFCSNTLGQTQCNGLTRVAFGTVVFVGVLQGVVGLILGGFLSLSRAQKRGITLAWVLALEGTLHLITVSLEATSRFRPGTLGRFILIDKATAGLGLATLVLFFAFHIVYASFLAKQYDGKVVLIVVLLQAPLAVMAFGFNFAALYAISYQELPAGIRAGARDVNKFLKPSTKALVFMLSFMCLTFITQLLLHSLLRKREIEICKQQEARIRKGISVFSSSTIEKKGAMELKKPVVHYFHTLIPSTLLAIIKTSLAFSPPSTIIARRFIGLIEYTGYVFVIACCLHFTPERTAKCKNLFSQLPSNLPPVYFENQNFGLPQTNPDPSILTRADMASFGIGRLHPRGLDNKNSVHRYPRKTPHIQRSPPKSRKSRLTRTSYAAQSAFSSLAPEDSASTAAFLPRQPPPQTLRQTRTTRGPNGSVLAPLQEHLVVQLSGYTTDHAHPSQ